MHKKKTRCLTCRLWRVSGAPHDCAAALAAEIQKRGTLIQQHQNERQELGRRLRALWREQSSAFGPG